MPKLVVAYFAAINRGWASVLALRWAAAGPGGGLFLVLDADIAPGPPSDGTFMYRS